MQLHLDEIPPATPVHMPFSSDQADWQPWKIMSIARRNWAIVGQQI
jgi:hypothetical protein